MFVRSAVLTACIVAATAAAAEGRAKPRPLWATVNVCNTPKSPHQMGVRAQMWGDGTRERMYMRFTAEYRAGAKWQVVAGHGRSPWLLAGSARYLNQQVGYTFGFDAPPAGRSYLMRGLAQFEWRDRRKRGRRVRTVVVRRGQRYTTGGHRTKGAEPRGFSAATCTITG